jgi:hypothetical protein
MVESVGGFARVDNPSVLSEGLARAVTNRSLKLRINCENPSTGSCNVFYEGQAGIPKTHNGDCIIATAKRNLLSEKNSRGKMEYAVGATVFLPSGIDFGVQFADLGTELVTSDSLELRDGIMWKYGHDFSSGALKYSRTEEDFFSHVESFNLVRPDFTYKVGIKVGIVVFSHKGATVCSSQAPVGYAEKQIREIYGDKDLVNIHTGVITCVGLRHIEYDINTFGGCSGALAFVLDTQPPGSGIKHFVCQHRMSCDHARRQSSKRTKKE